jgi:hypothetical protein
LLFRDLNAIFDYDRTERLGETYKQELKMPEIVFEALDKVPEGLREHAKEEDGKISVNVVPKTKLDEFRETNIKLAQERDSLKSSFDPYKEIIGDDPGKFKKSFEELQKIQKRVKDGELVANTSLEEAIAARTKELRADLEGKISSLSSDRDAWKDKATTIENKHKRSIVDRHVTSAVLSKDSGARPDALSDILERAYKTFKVDETKEAIIPYEGEQVIYGSDGASPMSPLEWLRKMKETSPYFFQSSGGGGAGGGPGIPGPQGYSQEQIAKMDLPTYQKLRKEGKI